MSSSNSYDIDRTISALQGMKIALDTYATSPEAWEIINRLVAAMEIGPGPRENNGSLTQHVAVGLRNFFDNKPLPTRPEA